MVAAGESGFTVAGGILVAGGEPGVAGATGGGSTGATPGGATAGAEIAPCVGGAAADSV